MCFIFTCGEHEFSDYLQGYENVTAQCHNCGNFSAHVLKRWNWFTFCFVPVLPLSMHSYKDVVCNICRFAQPLENRQDVIGMARNPNAGSEMQPPQHQYSQGPPGGHPGGGPPPGWGGNQGGPGSSPAPGQKSGQNMQYG